MDSAATWDERYSARPDMYGTEPNATVADLTRDLAPGRALDLAAGEGRNAVWLAGRGHRVTAVDVSTVALGRAADRADAAGLEVDLVNADLAEYVPDAGEFDLVVLSYLQVPDELRRVVHRRAAAALAPGGRIVLVAHHCDNLEHGYGGPQSAEVLFDEDRLRADFAVLVVERCEQVLRVVCPGAVEESTAIDVLCVAVRPADDAS